MWGKFYIRQTDRVQKEYLDNWKVDIPIEKHFKSKCIDFEKMLYNMITHASKDDQPVKKTKNISKSEG